MSPGTLDAVFAKLQLTYGARLQSAYTGMSPAAVRDNWAGELRGITDTQVAFAMANLPEDHPPNVLQFRAMCLRSPAEPMRPSRREPEALPPVAMPEQVREQLASLRMVPGVTGDLLSGARRLRERERSGERLSMAQRDFWRRALGAEVQGDA